MATSLPPAEQPARACPICGRPASPKTQPFCSRGCAAIDLNRWLDGRYRIPAAAASPADEPDAEPDEKPD